MSGAADGAVVCVGCWAFSPLDDSSILSNTIEPDFATASSSLADIAFVSAALLLRLALSPAWKVTLLISVIVTGVVPFTKLERGMLIDSHSPFVFAVIV